MPKISISEHLAGLDGLASDGRADLFFGQLRETWSVRLPAEGRFIHSDRPGGQLHRAALKRRADDFSRSEAEVYSFHTATNLSEKEGDRLLSWLTNVSNTVFLRKRHKIAEEECFCERHDDYIDLQK